VAGLGIQPKRRARRAGGVHVTTALWLDELLRSSVSGDLRRRRRGQLFNPALGTRLRVEHEDNANTMGAAAGRSMAGRGRRTPPLPFFYSDLFALGYEAVGELDRGSRS